MASKLIVFDANDFVKLLTHYTEGKVPIDAELKQFGVGTQLQRQIGLLLFSKQWPAKDMLPGKDYFGPLHIRYEGKRVMSWGKKGDDVFWQDQPETPRFKQ